MNQSFSRGFDPTRGVKLMIDLGVTIMGIVERRVAIDEIVDVAVRIDCSRPAERERFEIAFSGKLQRGGEFGRQNADVETTVLGHGLNDLGNL